MKWKIILSVTIFVLGSISGYAISFLFSKYKTTDKTDLPITEFTPLEYPDDPASLSTFYQRYTNRRLHLSKTGETLFDFTFISDDKNVATITLQGIDLSLFIPLVPSWIKGNLSMEKITLVEREWNRQQVSFTPDSPQFTITGGDGFETQNLISCELTRNCLNAGLWEILLYSNEEGNKVLYYHGWFEFPLGHYKEVFEKINQLSYWRHWHRLEHWSSPAGKKIDLETLRTPLETLPLKTVDLSNERVIARGEQYRKLRTLSAEKVLNWRDFLTYREHVAFATFLPPGRYEVSSRWENEYERINTLETAILRRVKCPACTTHLFEIECVYRNNLKKREFGKASIRNLIRRSGAEAIQLQPVTQSYSKTDASSCFGSYSINRLIIGGIDLSQVPILRTEDYDKGYQMPLGISVPPVFQSYDALQLVPTEINPYYSFMIDAQNGWIDHHKAAIDGVILHRDTDAPEILHFYLLSYERHTLIAHYKLYLPSL
ncbi:MAG: hypothetical protein KDK55_04130 [Chlamydiia bacterium]|nr:hypothetical protein [Chlamydiia bacterium]